MVIAPKYMTYARPIPEVGNDECHGLANTGDRKTGSCAYLAPSGYRTCRNDLYGNLSPERSTLRAFDVGQAVSVK